MRVADELGHHDDAADYEDDVEDARPEAAKIGERGDGPRRREGRAEDLGADQDRGANHGEHVLPDDAAARSRVGSSYRFSPSSGRNVPETDRRIKPLRPSYLISLMAEKGRSAELCGHE